MPVISVAADGSGNYTTIAAALDAAPTTGVVISVKDGTYTLAGPLMCSKPKVTIVGESQAGVIIVSAAGQNAINITADDVRLSSLTVDGGRGTGGTGGGIDIVSAQRTYVGDCLVKNTSVQGIKVSGSPRSDYGIIENCTIANLATDGVTPVAGGFLPGIQIISGGDYWTIRNNIITGWSQAIGLWYGCGYCTVTGNTLIDNYGYADAGHTIPRSALEVFPETTVGGHHIISNNIIDGATLHCIESAQGDNGTLYSYNTLSNWSAFSNVGSPVVFVDGGVLQRNIDVVFDHNTLTSPGRGGAALLAGYNTIYTNNAHHDFTYSGLDYVVLLYNPDDQTVSYNTFDNCQGCVYARRGNGHVISHNEVTNPIGNKDQFYFEEGGACDVSYNTVNTPGVAGKGITIDGGVGGHTITYNNIQLSGPALKITVPDNVVNNNNFSTSPTYCVNCSGVGCTNNTITDNVITVTDWWEVLFDADSSLNICQHNTFSGAGWGVRDLGTGNTIGPNP